MHLQSSLLCLLTFVLASVSYAQTENTVDIIPHWTRNETHAVKIKSTTTDIINGKTQNYLSGFDAKFTVKEASDKGYELEWIYTNVTLADNEPVIENQLVAKMVNKKFMIRFSDVGKFTELLNVDEIKSAADKAVDELITGSADNPTMNAQYKTAKQLVASKQGLETALLKQIKIYHLSFGYNYTLNKIQTNNMKFPNPLGGQAFDAVEKVQLTKLDNKNAVCIVETNKIIDGNALKLAVMEYVKKATNSNPQTMEQIGKASVEIAENSMHQLDFEKSLVQKASFQRTINLGFQNRVTLLEIEPVN